MADISRPFRVEVNRAFCYLEKKDYDSYRKDGSRSHYVYGYISITIFIHNDRSKASPEIEDVYFYTGDEWTFYQGNDECLYMQSDMTNYKKRHMIKFSHKRISKKSWVELTLIGKKLLDHNENPIEKDRYLLSGQAIIRFTTSDSVHDYQIPMNVECTDIALHFDLQLFEPRKHLARP